MQHVCSLSLRIAVSVVKVLLALKQKLSCWLQWLCSSKAWVSQPRMSSSRCPADSSCRQCWNNMRLLQMPPAESLSQSTKWTSCQKKRYVPSLVPVFFSGRCRCGNVTDAADHPGLCCYKVFHCGDNRLARCVSIFGVLCACMYCMTHNSSPVCLQQPGSWLLCLHHMFRSQI